jgi:cell wall-associated NlpC family hydrolase
MRDYHYQKYGIQIKPHHDSFDWINKGEGIVYPYYDAYMEDWGFKEISGSEVEEGDVVIMSVRGTANHLGVLVGDNRILHHMVGMFSGTETRARIQSFVHKYVRHKDKP